MTSDKLAYWDIQFCFVHNPHNVTWRLSSAHRGVRGEREADLKNAKITPDLQHYEEKRVDTADNLEEGGGDKWRALETCPYFEGAISIAHL